MNYLEFEKNLYIEKIKMFKSVLSWHMFFIVLSFLLLIFNMFLIYNNRSSMFDAFLSGALLENILWSCVIWWMNKKEFNSFKKNLAEINELNSGY